MIRLSSLQFLLVPLTLASAQEPTPRAVAAPEQVRAELRGATDVLEREDGTALVLLFERGRLAHTASGLDAVRVLPLQGAFGRLMLLEDGRAGVARQDRQDVLVIDRDGARVDSIATPASARTFVVGSNSAVALIDRARNRYELGGSRAAVDAPLLRSRGSESTVITTVRRRTLARMTIGAAGSSTSGGGAFEPVDAWVLAPDGRIAVVRGGEYRIVWFGAGGDSVTGPAIAHTAMAVTEAHRGAFRREQQASLDEARRMLGGGLGDGAMSVPEPTWHSTLPAMRGDRLLLGTDGTVWVPRHGEATEMTTVWDAFDARGQRRNRVAIPAGWTLVGAGRGTLYLAGAAGLGVVSEPQ